MLCDVTLQSAWPLVLLVCYLLLLIQIVKYVIAFGTKIVG